MRLKLGVVHLEGTRQRVKKRGRGRKRSKKELLRDAGADLPVFRRRASASSSFWTRFKGVVVRVVCSHCTCEAPDGDDEPDPVSVTPLPPAPPHAAAFKETSLSHNHLSKKLRSIDLVDEQLRTQRAAFSLASHGAFLTSSAGAGARALGPHALSTTPSEGDGKRVMTCSGSRHRRLRPQAAHLCSTSWYASAASVTAKERHSEPLAEVQRRTSHTIPEGLEPPLHNSEEAPQRAPTGPSMGNAQTYAHRCECGTTGLIQATPPTPCGQSAGRSGDEKLTETALTPCR